MAKHSASRQRRDNEGLGPSTGLGDLALKALEAAGTSVPAEPTATEVTHTVSVSVTTRREPGTASDKPEVQDQEATLPTLTSNSPLSSFTNAIREHFKGKDEAALEKFLDLEDKSWPKLYRALSSDKPTNKVSVGDSKLSFAEFCASQGVSLEQALGLPEMVPLLEAAKADRNGLGPTWKRALRALDTLDPSSADLAGAIEKILTPAESPQAAAGAKSTDAAAETPAVDASPPTSKVEPVSANPEQEGGAAPVTPCASTSTEAPQTNWAEALALEAIKQAAREAFGAAKAVGLYPETNVPVDFIERSTDPHDLERFTARFKKQTELWRVFDQPEMGGKFSVADQDKFRAAIQDAHKDGHFEGLASKIDAVACLNKMIACGLRHEADRSEAVAKMLSMDGRQVARVTSQHIDRVAVWQKIPDEFKQVSTEAVASVPVAMLLGEQSKGMTVRELICGASSSRNLELVFDAVRKVSTAQQAKIKEKPAVPTPTEPKSSKPIATGEDSKGEVVGETEAAPVVVPLPDWATNLQAQESSVDIADGVVSFRVDKDGKGVLSSKLGGLEVEVEIAQDTLAKFADLDEAKSFLLQGYAPDPIHAVDNDFVRHLTLSKEFLIRKFSITDNETYEHVGLNLRCAPGAELSFTVKDSVVRVVGRDLCFKNLSLLGSTTPTFNLTGATKFEKYNFEDRVVWANSTLGNANFLNGTNRSDMVDAELKGISVQNFSKAWKGTKFAYAQVNEALFKRDVVKELSKVEYASHKKDLNIKAYDALFKKPDQVSRVLYGLGVSVMSHGQAEDDDFVRAGINREPGTEFTYIDTELPRVCDESNLKGVTILVPSAANEASLSAYGLYQVVDRGSVLDRARPLALSGDPEDSWQKLLANFTELYVAEAKRRKALLEEFESAAQRKPKTPPVPPAGGPNPTTGSGVFQVGPS